MSKLAHSNNESMKQIEIAQWIENNPPPADYVVYACLNRLNFLKKVKAAYIEGWCCGQKDTLNDIWDY